VLNAVLDALKENTKVEALYIQNFEDGFFDEQLAKLTEVLKLKRIWCLNVGENFRTTLPAWRQFARDLEDTAVSHMYASEHHFIGTDVKRRMKDVIRETRKANVIPHSLEVIMNCGNMWFNPKLPKWAQDVKGGAAAIIARQQAASADSSVCALAGAGGERAPGEDGTKPRAKKMGSVAASGIEAYLREKRSISRGHGKRVVHQTAKGAAFVSGETAKHRRTEKLRRERLARKKQEAADAATAEKNVERVKELLRQGGGAAVVGWKVRVWWPLENEWFHGTVTKFEQGGAKHLVEYEDGDTQHVLIGKLAGDTAKVGFLRAPRGQGIAAKEKASGGEKRKKPEPPPPTRKSSRAPARRAESPPPPPGGLRGSHGIRAAAQARRLQQALDSAPKRRRSSLGGK
jgi:hypothetical protein